MCRSSPRRRRSGGSSRGSWRRGPTSCRRPIPCRALLSPAKEAFADVAFRDAPSLARTPVVRWTDDFGSLASVLKAQDFRLLWGDSAAQRTSTLDWRRLGREDLPAAEAAFRQALDAEPRNAATWIHLGNVLRRDRNTADAMRAYLQAIEIDDVHSEAHNNLGMP